MVLKHLVAPTQSLVKIFFTLEEEEKSSTVSKIKTVSSADKMMTSVFRNSSGILLIYYLVYDQTFPRAY